MASELPNWQELSDRLASTLPSTSYRAATLQILEKVTQLGPMGDPEREFRRIYRFLHYNEPSRVIQVLDELLKAHTERREHLQIRNNAWKYVVRAFDSWVGRARIFYLAVGIVEGALRSRLNERLTAVYGPTWPTQAGLVPSSVVAKLKEEADATVIATIHRIVEETQSAGADPERQVSAFDAIAKAISTRDTELPSNGEEFCRRLSFSDLRTFFQSKRLWGSAANLGSLFRPLMGHGDPPLRGAVDEALKTIHEVRNEIAHYRPSGKLSFLNGLLATAKLARWLEVDLQDFYSAVDTKFSTELSHLLESHYPPLRSRLANGGATCATDGCALGDPIDILLQRAPTSWPDEDAVRDASLGCAYHRVKVREAAHGVV
ncbi:MAG: hypothetical protein HY700_21900 [Gemmatimonadetes bacterium]|nr:hypothetical protein [Gemmatimonadota bacterium]